MPTNDTPTSRVIDWAALVKRLLGPDQSQKEDVYNFSNGRKFKTTDHLETGIYRAPTED